MLNLCFKFTMNLRYKSYFIQLIFNSPFFILKLEPCEGFIHNENNIDEACINI